MEKYNYFEAMINDIINYIKENNIDFYKLNDDLDMQQELEEKLFLEDSVTGNESGSYFRNTWKAEEAICHNMILAKEAYEEFGYDWSKTFDAELIDVTIRCYLLPQTLNDAIQRLINDDDFRINQILKGLRELDVFPNDSFRVTIYYYTINLYCKCAIGESDLERFKDIISTYYNLENGYRDNQTFFMKAKDNEINLWARINRA